MKRIYSDREIIEILNQAEDHQTDRAFRYLYKTYFGMALQFVRINNGDDSDAEDVFQDVLVAFYRNVRTGKFRGDSAIKTYLYSMVRNQWLVRLKKNQRNVNMENPEHADKTMYVVQSSYKTEDLANEVNKLLSEVSDRCRELLKLYYFDNLSMSELAERAGFDNENSAKTQKYKCMQRLIKIMADRSDLKKMLYEMLAEQNN